jgi:hypothetical protein
LRPAGAATPAFAAGANTSIARKTAARRTADIATRVVGRVLGLACPSFEGQAGGQDERVIARSADDLD